MPAKEYKKSGNIISPHVLNTKGDKDLILTDSGDYVDMHLADIISLSSDDSEPESPRKFTSSEEKTTGTEWQPVTKVRLPNQFNPLPPPPLTSKAEIHQRQKSKLLAPPPPPRTNSMRINEVTSNNQPPEQVTRNSYSPQQVTRNSYSNLSV